MRKIGILTCVIFLPVLVIGFVVRGTFVNANDLSYYTVATAGAHIVTALENSAETIGENSAYILKVKCKTDTQFLFKKTYQEAEVLEVFQGKEDVAKGDVINISPGASHIFSDDDSINMGFVNEMRVDKEYLVFLGDKMTSVELEMDLYPTTEFIMTLIFGYEDRENNATATGYVSYDELKDCEFFSETKAGIRKFLEAKNKLLEKYN